MRLLRPIVRWTAWSSLAVVASTALLVALAFLFQSWWLPEAGLPPPGKQVALNIGSGFFVTANGWVLTNRHVVPGCLRVTVGNKRLSAVVPDRIVYPTDSELDLAALHLRLAPAAFLRFERTPWPTQSGHASSSELFHDLTIINTLAQPSANILGYPGSYHGADPVHASAKIMSATRSVPSQHWVLEVRSAIEPGSSGSPLLDSKGGVLGVVYKAVAHMHPGYTSAQLRQALAGLHKESTFGSVIPAEVAAGFVSRIDPTPSSTPAAHQKPDDAIVRVFCFLDLHPR